MVVWAGAGLGDGVAGCGGTAPSTAGLAAAAFGAFPPGAHGATAFRECRE
jgi:hypothetical protein